MKVGSLSEARGLVQLSELFTGGQRPDELAQLSEGLRRLLTKALAEKPDDRYQTLPNLASALKKVKS